MWRTKFAVYFPRCFDVATEGTTTTTTTAAPWYKADAYAGRVDDHTIGYWQNRYAEHINNPAEIALAASKAHREAEAKLGIPSNEILRVPSKPDDAGWQNVWDKLGVPKDAKDYAFKNADGTDMPAAVADELRAAAAKAHLTKEAAAEMAQTFTKIQSKAGDAAQAEATAKLAQEKAALEQSWGQNAAANQFIAQQAIAKLAEQIQKPELIEAVSKLEGTIGYAKVMEMFRVIGQGMGEGKFVQGGKTDGGAMSYEQAVQKRGELKNDTDFVKRFNEGDSGARREMDALDYIIVNRKAA